MRQIDQRRKPGAGDRELIAVDVQREQPVEADEARETGVVNGRAASENSVRAEPQERHTHLARPATS